MPDHRSALTIIVLAHRADDRLVKSVASANFAQEILVVVTDHHPAIAERLKKFPVRLVNLFPEFAHQPFDFSWLRNQALNLAKFDWVFFLDSDEIFASRSQSQIDLILINDQINAAWVKRVDIFAGRPLRWGEVGNYQVVRIGRKAVMKFIRPVHELAQVSGNIGQSSIILYHYAHLSVSEFVSKVGTYAALEAQYRHQLHDDPLMIESLIYPKGKFLFNYFLKFGIGDGWPGLVYAIMMSFHSFFVRVFSYELTHPLSHRRS